MKFLISLIAISLVGSLSCGKKKKKGPPTVMVIPEMEPPVTKNKPAAFGLVTAVSQGPRACVTDDPTACPYVGETIRSRLFDTNNGNSIIKMLDAVDGRITELENRIGTENRVPCFDEASTAATVNFATNHSYTVKLNCYDTYTGPGGGTGHMAFGKGDDSSYFIVDRYSATNSVITRVAYQDKNSNVEVWSAGYDNALSAKFSTLYHLYSEAGSGTIELTVAGSPTISGAGSPGIGMACGVQYKSNSSYIYVKGRFGDQSDQTACTTYTEHSVCLVAGTFAETDLSNCTSAGLNTMKLTQIQPSEINASTFESTIKLDYSGSISKFATVPVEEKEE